MFVGEPSLPPQKKKEEVKGRSATGRPSGPLLKGNVVRNLGRPGFPRSVRAPMGASFEPRACSVHATPWPITNADLTGCFTKGKAKQGTRRAWQCAAHSAGTGANIHHGKACGSSYRASPGSACSAFSEQPRRRCMHEVLGSPRAEQHHTILRAR